MGEKPDTKYPWRLQISNKIEDAYTDCSNTEERLTQGSLRSPVTEPADKA